jgi:ankyrin repeat protein
VQSIQSGNLEAVHQLLSMRRFLPNDRDEDGDSLLMVSGSSK